MTQALAAYDWKKYGKDAEKLKIKLMIWSKTKAWVYTKQLESNGNKHLKA